MIKRILAGIALFIIAIAGVWGTDTFFKTRYISGRLNHLYTLDTACHAFSPDGTLIIGTSNVYEAATGTIRIKTDYYSVANGLVDFSPDSKLIALYGYGRESSTPNGVFNTSTGERWLDLPWGRFTQDGKLLIASFENAVYEVATGKELLKKDGSWDFTEDRRFLIISGDGVYNVDTFERLYTIGKGKTWRGANDSLLAVSGDGLYELATGKRRFAIGESETVLFRADVGVLLVKGDGIYSLATGERLLNKFDRTFSYVLSRDGKWIALPNDGVYSSVNGQQVLPLSRDVQFLFSPDSKYLIVEGNGVYDVTTWQKRFAIDETPSWGGVDFNAAGTMVLISGDGIYELSTGKRLFPVNRGGSFSMFLHNDEWVIVTGDAVYEVASGRKLFDAPYSLWRTNPDKTELIVAGSGVYNLETGQRRFSLGQLNKSIRIAASGAFNIPFSQDGSLMWVAGDSVYDYHRGERLLSAHDAFEVLFDPKGTLLAVVGQKQNSCQVYEVSAP